MIERHSKRAQSVGAIGAVLVWMTVAGCRTLQPVKLQADDPRLSRLSWITGSWVSRLDDRTSEEHWTHATAGMMLGLGRTCAGDKTVFFEFLRIEARPDGLYYVACPRGRHETAFRLIESAPGRAVFENPKHDFPQRIIYWRTKDGALHSRVEGYQGPQFVANEWLWTPARIVIPARVDVQP